MPEVHRFIAQGNPFPGLRSFERADAPLFFGRDQQVQALRRKLAHGRFLAVVGSSGSGKSSLVKAGLIPQLAAQANGSPAWQVAFCTPGAAPLRQLAEGLRQTFAAHPAAQAALAAPNLELDPAAIVSWCGEANMLLFIDQFEELFRYQSEQEGREQVNQFINLLLALSQTPGYPVYVVLTMRSDYLDACTDYPGLTDAVNQGSYLLPKMNRAEIEQAITTPVARMGAQMAPTLTARLLADMGGQTDHLPILQHALMRTWDHWQRKQQPGQPLSEADYEAVGTIRRAVTVHAEEIFADLPNEKTRLATEKLFKALIVLGTGDAGVVHPLSLREVGAITDLDLSLLADVADRFREPGVAFLTPLTDIPADDKLIIDLGHERLMALWERLRTWVSEETESAKFYQQLSHAATLYHAGKAGLWTNPELQIGLKWLADNRPTAAWANRYDPYLERAINFLEYSKKQFDFKEEHKAVRQQRELKRTRLFAIVLGAGALVSLLFLMISAVLRTQAQQSEDRALAEQKNAQFERTRAEGQTREAITQKKISDQQEAITRQQKQLTEEQRILAVQAQQVAVEKRNEAEVAQRSADEQRQRALVASQQALAASQDARRQEALARLAQKDAESQRGQAVGARKDAEKQRNYAEQQRGKAVARTVAIEAVQLPDSIDQELPALLAQAAFRLNASNGGQASNPDIFNALAKVTNTQSVLRGHNDNVRAVAVPPAAGPPLLASGSDDGSVRVWPRSGSAQPTFTYWPVQKPIDGVRSLLFSSDGKYLYGGSEKGRLTLWNITQPTAPPISLPAHAAAVHTLLWQPGPNPLLVSISADGSVRSWRPRPGGGLDTVQTAHAPAGMALYCASFTADGKRLVCGANQKRIISFDAKNLRAKPAIFTRDAFGDRVTALAFSPISKQLITGNSRGLVYAWQLVRSSNPEKPQQLSGRHTSTVSNLVFSPNGEQLASCSADWTIHLWDTRTMLEQQQPIVLTDFAGWVMDIGFTPDGKSLVGASADRTVRIRTVDVSDMYQQLSRKITRKLTRDEWSHYVGEDMPYPEDKTKLN